MARFIIRRLIQMVGVVFVLSLLLFLWLRSLPGGPVSAILGERARIDDRVDAPVCRHGPGRPKPDHRTTGSDCPLLLVDLYP